ncbi:2-keto-4-pentenoate hydratase [Saccharopolyspora shandongensis]|uniref:2-keto-4-pentenoate hydratase n=1 Tax=Saccharopolyspora shandongensis TaxID=418495 RepID=UPI0033C1645D
MSTGTTQERIEAVAKELLHAEETRTDRHPVTDEWPGLDLATAYRIQDRLLAGKVARGDQLVGVKLGLTSRAKQQRMGIDSPLTAWLTAGMVLDSGVPIPTDQLIHPRVEPEIVFILGERLSGPGVTAESAMDAVRSVYAGLEVIDSRFVDFRFTLPNVVADNASSARFVLGGVERDPRDLDLALEACVLQVDDAVVDTATGAAVQGHPAQALAVAANTLAERGLALEAGWTILTGGMTDAVTVHTGQRVVAEFAHLGKVSVAVA